MNIFRGPKPKNYRNGKSDISPPIKHDDPSPRVTRMRLGSSAIVIVPGPEMLPVNPQILLPDLLKLMREGKNP